MDPVDSSFWTIQEYAESPQNTWGTWWAHVDNVTFAAATPAAQINTGNKSAITISPNPAHAFASIMWNEDNVAKVKIQLSNSKGNVLFIQEFNALKGINKLAINTGNFISGVYSVSVFNGVDVKKAQLSIE